MELTRSTLEPQESGHAPLALDERLSPELRRRVGRLLSDLAYNDVSMALLDLAQLYRGLASMVEPGSFDRSNDEEDWERFFL